MNDAEKSDPSNVAKHEKMKMPIRWIAPECLEFGKFSEKSDVWVFNKFRMKLFFFSVGPLAFFFMRCIPSAKLHLMPSNTANY